MVLTAPIPLVLTSDPVAKYVEIAATIPAGKRYVQNFDYTIKENPEIVSSKYVELICPGAPVFADDGVDSWDLSQRSLGACGTYANIAAYASVPIGCKYRLEESIYPTEPSPIGLYFIRICNPDDPTTTIWMAIDSKIPATRMGKSAVINFDISPAIAPALFLKAAATARGGSFDEITNSGKLGKKFAWFPNKSVTASTFAEFSNYLTQGGLCVTAMAQQYDAGGMPITPDGVVLGHAWAIVDVLTATNADGSLVNLVRFENPWGQGSDYLSEYDENAPFWAEHPELSGKLADAKQTKGNYWVNWETCLKITGRAALTLTVPI